MFLRGGVAFRPSASVASSVFRARNLSSMGKLEDLRSLLAKKGLDAYVVPTQDAHLSEYVADVDKRREWLTGFTGSAGTAVVTKDKALLWTDGRYYEQAEKELSGEWELVRGADPGVKQVPDFLAETFGESNAARIGVNPDTISFTMADKWDKVLLASSKSTCSVCEKLKSRGSTQKPCETGQCKLLVPIFDDLVDQIWKDKPERPKNKIKVHPDYLAGRSMKEKVASVREEMKKEDVDLMVLSSLDEIAWLLNLRGEDILYTPVFFSFVVISMDELTLFVNQEAIKDCEAHLKTGADGKITILPYEEIKSFLDKKEEEPPKKRAKTESTSSESKKTRVWLDSENCSLSILLYCKNMDQFFQTSPIRRAKALKNDQELEGMCNAHINEGIALCKFFCWLENAITKGEETIDEVTASDKIEEFRTQHEDYRGPSFDTISSFGANGAVIHYKPKKETAKIIGKDSLYLCDTGGQYISGTTDMTRTMCFGTPTERQKLAYTLVLEGHIALAKAVFFEGTEPSKLDVLARSPLWKYGLDYKHGTSHGVGAYLGVHEFPPLMHGSLPSAKRFKGKVSPTSMAAGMVLSNEPGFYHSGEFGIRIENVVMTKKRDPESSMTDELRDPKTTWLDFETITLVPIQTKLIDTNILSAEGKEWLNEYHIKCRYVLGPILEKQNDLQTYQWLMTNTEKLP